MCEDDSGEVWDRLCQCGLDVCDAVACAEEGLEAGGEGEVGEVGDVVVCEVDGILWLRMVSQTIEDRRGKTYSGYTQVLNGWYLVSYS